MALTKLNFSGQPTLPSASMPTGTVLQSKSTGDVGDLGQVNTGNTTFTDISGVDLVITPIKSNSLFLIWHQLAFDTGGAAQAFIFRLTYNHSGISQSVIDDRYDSQGYEVFSANARFGSFGQQILNLAPATTNEITFRQQFRASGSYTVYVNRGLCKIMVQEIAQ
tara:strand:- start:233 stop:727 length:495 start_codon:yes stop_codon:yes gene_type:complete